MNTSMQKLTLSNLAGACSVGALLMAPHASAVLEETIVTAQKRSESVQDVPIAMQAFTGDQLKNRGISSVADIVQLTPNLNISGQSSNNKQINIRGVGTSDLFANQAGSVGVYMDEVTMSAPYLTSLGLHDIERVEILRGPQNSLFGRNTTGGAVNFISVQPEVGEGPTGFFEATVGNFERIELDGAVTFPLGENAAVRLAGKSFDRAGIWDNEAENGDEHGEKDRKSARGTLVWEPAESTRLTGSVRYAEEDSDYNPVKAVGLRGERGTAFNGGLVPNPDVPTGELDFGDAHPGSNSQGDNPSLEGWENVNITGTYVSEVESAGAYLKLTHELDFATFTSITSYDDTEVLFSYDTGAIGNLAPTTVSTLAAELGLSDGASPQISGAIDQDLNWKGWAQELRLTSHSDSQFRWVTGLYLFHEESEMMSSVRFGQFLGPANVGNILGGLFAGFTLLGDPTGYGHKAAFHYAEIENNLWSPYLHSEFDITDDLTLVVGLRFTNDSKEITDNIVGNVSTLGDDIGQTVYDKDLLLARSAGSQICTGNETQVCEEDITDQREDNDTEKWGGKVGLDYRFSDDVMVYGHYSHGFRGGKHDIEFLHGPQTGWGLVDPGAESLDAFELGVKSTLLDGDMQLNASTYFYLWEDQQSIFVDPASGPQLLNIPEAELYGLEVELNWAPSDTFLIQAGLGLQHTEITEASDTGLDEEGHELPFAADTSANLLIVKDFEIGDGLLSLQADWAYRSAPKAYPRPQDYIDELEETSKVNARVSYAFGSDQQFQLAIFGENLTEEESCQYKYNLFLQSGSTFCVANEAEAFYGVKASYRF